MRRSEKSQEKYLYSKFRFMSAIISFTISYMNIFMWEKNWTNKEINNNPSYLKYEKKNIAYIWFLKYFTFAFISNFNFFEI